jgi:hypothetical protein
MRGVITHIARWFAWHAEGAAIGSPDRPHARITIVSTDESELEPERQGG